MLLTFFIRHVLQTLIDVTMILAPVTFLCAYASQYLRPSLADLDEKINEDVV